MRVQCPHCSKPAVIRTSKEITEITREAKAQCTNVECAHTWVFHVSAVRTIAPSMTPNPKVFIPLSPKSPAAPTAEKQQLGLGLDDPGPRAMANTS